MRCGDERLSIAADEAKIGGMPEVRVSEKIYYRIVQEVPGLAPEGLCFVLHHRDPPVISGIFDGLQCHSFLLPELVRIELGREPFRHRILRELTGLVHHLSIRAIARVPLSAENAAGIDRPREQHVVRRRSRLDGAAEAHL